MRTRIPGAVGTLFALDMAVKQYIEENVNETEEKSLCGTGILSAGALSNTYDRVVRGKVVDYIGIKSSHKILGNITANLADIYILLGSVFAFLKKKID